MTALQAYAEDWRKNQGKLDDNEAAALERRLRLHVYEGKPGSGRTPRGGVAIGQRLMRDLARRPSLIQTWITAMPLKDSSASQVVKDVVAVFRAAVDDGVVTRNPVLADSVDRPVHGRSKARPWPREHLDAMEGELPGPLKVFPKLGAGTSGRQGELFGLGKDDIRFLGRDPRVNFVRQVKMVCGKAYFAPLKNQKDHSPPLARSLAERLAQHMAEYPAAAVTLEWYDPSDQELHGTLVTVELVLHNNGQPWTRDTFGSRWVRARRRAGIEVRPAKGESRRSSRRDGATVLRHMAASAWLRSGIDVVRVAAWPGDTPEIVLSTYAHLMPERDDDDGREAINEMLSGDAVARNRPWEESEAELSQVDGLLT